MKKHLMIFMVILLAVAVATPALAAVEFKYGGNWRFRYNAQQNIYDGFEPDTQLEPQQLGQIPGAPPGTFFVPGVNTGRGFVSRGGQTGTAFANYNGDDNRTFVDYRIRMYFTFEASKNLKVVTAFEIGDAVYGQGGSLGGTGVATNVGANEGANVGGDAVAVEVKNVYANFNIPNTPMSAIVGLAPLTLLDGWIVNDDLPAAVLITDLKPFKVSIGYVGGQNGWERCFTNQLATTDQTFNVDDAFIALDYAEGPFKANLTFFAQDGHDSMMSLDPRTLFTPIRNFAGGPDSLTGGNVFGFTGTNPLMSSFGFLDNFRQPKDNLLMDIGLNLTYKTDWLLAYVNFVRNFGSVDLVNPSVVPNAFVRPAFAANPALGLGPLPAALVAVNSLNRTADYEGWMVDAGVTYYCGPWTANIGGFYTSGAESAKDPVAFSNPITVSTDGTVVANRTFRNLASNDVDWFTYPAGTSKAFSEIIGGGILGEDLHIIRGYSGSVTGAGMGSPASLDTVMWRGYYNPTNLWTVTIGGSYQVAEKTKISASYWYFGNPEEVPVAWRPPTAWSTATVVGPNITGSTLTVGRLGTGGSFVMSDSVGHELNFYLDQGIVDGLTLTLVGAYLFAGDAYAPIPTTGYWLLPKNSTGTQTNMLADDSYELGLRLQWVF